jgi:cell division protein FtsQ
VTSTWRPAVLGAAALGVVTGGAWALSRLPFFRVRQLEIEGVRYLAPEQVVRSLGLAQRQSIWVRLGPIERRLEEVAGVVEARVSRRMPGTLRVQVVEETPVAFAPGPAGLVALDAGGAPLPYDPAATGMDLPVIPGSDPALLLLLARVQAADSALYDAVETARSGPRQTVILELGERRVMVRRAATQEELEAVGAVRRHLAAGSRAYAELDARFAGWVVVRRNRS